MATKPRVKKKVTYLQRTKAEKRIKGLKKKKKLNKELRSRYEDYKNRRNAGTIEKANRINEDWQIHKNFTTKNEQSADTIPTDMRNVWKEYNKKKEGARRKRKNSDSSAGDAEELRHFKTEIQDDEREMMPVKVNGVVVRRVKKIETLAPKEEEMEAEVYTESNDVEDMEEDSDAESDDSEPKLIEGEYEDLSELDPFDRLAREKELLAELQGRITSHVKSIKLDPQVQIVRMNDLLKLSVGVKIHPAIREDAQKLAISALTDVLIDIVPGYRIRELTETEKKQKMKKDTKQLANFEERLLKCYAKFLKCLERNAKKLVKSSVKSIREESFAEEFGLLSAECLGKLLRNLSHFNYGTNLTTCLVRLSLTVYDPLIDICCNALSDMFRNDTALEMSLHGAKEIAAALRDKKGQIPAKLLSTLSSLNIKNVHHKGMNEKRKLTKFELKRKTKVEKKFDKELEKVESDLKETEAAERMSTKLKMSTAIMNHVFLTYFRVLRRHQSLLSPVLAGLSKFAHLINVDFFDDLVGTFENLLESKSLSIVDSMLCVRTVCIVLSGEGKVLNIDPLKFYKSLYTLIPSIALHQNSEAQAEQIRLLCDCVDFMINQRRKLVPFGRVVAFVKRLLLLGFLLTPKQTIALLSVIRTNFIAHPKLSNYVMDEEDLVANGIYKADMGDPDYCNAISSDFVVDLIKYEKYPNPIVSAFARNIRSGLSTSGNERINLKWCTKKPADWLKDEAIKNVPGPFVSSVNAFAKKKNCSLNKENVFSTIQSWLKA